MEEYTLGETVAIDGKKSIEWIPVSIAPEVAFNSSRIEACCAEEFRNAADSSAGEQSGVFDEVNDTLEQWESELNSRSKENMGWSQCLQWTRLKGDGRQLYACQQSSKGDGFQYSNQYSELWEEVHSSKLHNRQSCGLVYYRLCKGV